MKKERVLDYVMEGLVFLLISGSLIHSLFMSLFLPISIWVSLGMTLLFYIAFSLSRKSHKLSMILLLSFSVIILVWIFLYLSRHAEGGVLGWFQWIKIYFFGDALLEPSLVYPSGWLIALIVSLIIYITAIYFNLFILPASIGVAVLGAEWFIGHDQIKAIVWLFALGIILLLNKKYYHQLSQSSTTPQQGYWQLASLPLAVVILLTSMYIIPKDTRNMKWKALAKKYDNISAAWADWVYFSGPRDPFRLSQTGFNNTSKQLGGPISLSEEVVLGVISPTPVYLRGTVLNEYTGYGWKNSITENRYKLKEVFWKDMKEKAFDLDEPIFKDLNEEQKDKLFPEFKVIIYHSGINASTLFNVQRTVKMTTGKLISFTPYYNGKGETFTSRHIKKDEYYMLDVRNPNIQTQEFREYLKEKSPNLDWKKPIPKKLFPDELYLQKLEEIRNNYMQIPQGLPYEVVALAMQITRNKSNSFDKAIAIEQYLKNNFTYTLKPGPVPQDQDFVYHFLFQTKKGYCTYFATSMVILCRAAGLPSRYIEGFNMPPNPRMANFYEVKKTNSHAWVEVYFPNVGWITFDPTSSSEGTPGNGQDTWPIEEPFPGDENQDPDNEQKPQEVIPGETEPEKTNEAPWYEEAILILPIVGITLLILLISSIIILILWYKLRLVRIPKLPLDKQLYIYYQEILWALGIYNYPMERGDTPYSLAEKVDKRIVNNTSSLMEISKFLVSNVYGFYEIAPEDIKKAKAYYLDIESRVKDLIGLFPFMKIWFARQKQLHSFNK